MRCATGLIAVSFLATGCFSYIAVEPGDVEPGISVRARVSQSASARIAPLLGATDALEIDKPEILLYEHKADGSYGLNGVEYIIPYRVWPKDSVPPKLLGRDMLKSEPLQLWYTHMWVWTPNKAGLFADWNPAVRCRGF